MPEKRKSCHNAHKVNKDHRGKAHIAGSVACPRFKPLECAIKQCFRLPHTPQKLTTEKDGKEVSKNFFLAFLFFSAPLRSLSPRPSVRPVEVISNIQLSHKCYQLDSGLKYADFCDAAGSPLGFAVNWRKNCRKAPIATVTEAQALEN